MFWHLKKYSIFISGSAFGAAIDYFATLCGVYFFNLSALTSLAASMLVSATAVFFWHNYITFRANKVAGKINRYIIFMIWSGVIFVLRAGFLSIFVKHASLALSLAASIIIASLISYMFSSKYIFKSDKS